MKNLNNKQLILIIGGAIISAIGASICCLSPAVLAILGLSSAGLFSKFEGLRPYLIGIAAILLAPAFYLTYRKKEVMCEGGECKISGAQKLNKIVLWVATLLIIGFIAFPYINLPSHISSYNKITGEFEEYIISVDGMTCAGCKFHVERAIKELDGIIYVEADHQKGQVYVKFDEDKININKIVSQIGEIGYKPIGYSKINKKGENR